MPEISRFYGSDFAPLRRHIGLAIPGSNHGIIVLEELKCFLEYYLFALFRISRSS